MNSIRHLVKNKLLHGWRQNVCGHVAQITVNKVRKYKLF